jgi:hypothetical protein
MNTQFNTAFVNQNNAVIALNLDNKVNSLDIDLSYTLHNEENLARADEILNQAPALFLMAD